PLGVAIDRQYRNVSRRALEDLIRYGFAPGKRRDKSDVGAVLCFPFGGECGEYLLLHHLFHHGESVERDRRFFSGVAVGARQARGRRHQRRRRDAQGDETENFHWPPCCWVVYRTGIGLATGLTLGWHPDLQSVWNDLVNGGKPSGELAIGLDQDIFVGI